MTNLYPLKKYTRVGKPMNANQLRASKENFLIFQLKGMIGTLGRQRYTLPEKEYQEVINKLDSSTLYLGDALRRIKMIQKERKLK